MRTSIFGCPVPHAVVLPGPPGETPLPLHKMLTLEPSPDTKGRGLVPPVPGVLEISSSQSSYKISGQVFTHY